MKKMKFFSFACGPLNKEETCNFAMKICRLVNDGSGSIKEIYNFKKQTYIAKDQYSEVFEFHDKYLVVKFINEDPEMR